MNCMSGKLKSQNKTKGEIKMMTPAEQEIAKLEVEIEIISNMQEKLIKNQEYEQSQALNSASWLMMAQIVRLRESN